VAFLELHESVGELAQGDSELLDRGSGRFKGGIVRGELFQDVLEFGQEREDGLLLGVAQV